MMAGWRDTPKRYGHITRGFHWLMAALFAWQFAGALLYVSIGDSALTKLVGGSHLTLGFTLLVLVLVRGLWTLANLRRRPLHRGRLGRAAATGHAVIYAVMVVQPGIALLRQYGSAKPFMPYGIPLMAERADKIEWMTVPADHLHYWLGFTFLAVVLGHVAMVLLHRVLWNEDVLSRMA